MAKKKNQLFRIVASLKPTEKAYFKKFGYKQEQSEPILAGLLDLVDDHVGREDFAEEKLQADFAKKYPGKNYVKFKSRLLEALLEALREYDAKGNDAERVYHWLAVAESLNKRNLFHDAWQVLQKAEKLARELEMVELLILIKSRKYYYEIFTQKYPAPAASHATLEDLQVDLDTLRNRVESDLAAYRILHFQKSIGVPRSAADLELFRDIRAHPSFGPDFVPALLRSRLDLAVAQAGILFSTGDTAGVIRIAEAVLRDYRPAPRLRKLLATKYLSLWDSFLQACLLSLDTERYERYNPQFQAIETIGPKDRQLKLGIDLYVRSIYAIVGRQLGTLPGLAAEFDAIREEDFIPAYRKVSLAYYMALGPFLNEDLDAAYSAIQWLKNNRSLGLRYDIEGGILAMECLILLERGEMEVLDYRLRAFHEFLRSRERMLGMEVAVGQMIREAAAAPNASERVEGYARSQARMEALLAENPAEGAFLQALDVVSWLISRREGRSFAEVYFERNLGAEG